VACVCVVFCELHLFSLNLDSMSKFLRNWKFQHGLLQKMWLVLLLLPFEYWADVNEHARPWKICFVCVFVPLVTSALMSSKFLQKNNSGCFCIHDQKVVCTNKKNELNLLAGGGAAVSTRCETDLRIMWQLEIQKKFERCSKPHPRGRLSVWPVHITCAGAWV
jgi:hypothetical protein